MRECEPVVKGGSIDVLVRGEGAVVLVDKPEGLTSMEVVRRIKRVVKKKCGHGGTLDPFASGLLVVAVGRCTKRLSAWLSCDKEYEGKLAIGIETDTLDPEGRVVVEKLPAKVEEEQVRRAMKELEGQLRQVPPAYSAVKIRGVRAYELARRGVKGVSLPERVVRIYSLEVLSLSEQTVTISGQNYRVPVVEFRVRCSKGTYIRVLGRQIAEALGYPGMLVALRRTAIGRWRVEEAWSLAQLLSRLRAEASAGA